jgi:ligand-binding SRPBCC domain-containing protein
MAVITTITKIYAPADRVFDLSRSVDLHVHSAGKTGETAIAGVTSGLLDLDQEVTWRGRHFGVWQNLTSKVTAFSRPDYFRDSMVKGAFLRLDHDHFFETQGSMTVMRDVFDFTSPLGFWVALQRFSSWSRICDASLLKRNAVIKKNRRGTRLETLSARPHD